MNADAPWVPVVTDDTFMENVRQALSNGYERVCAHCDRWHGHPRADLSRVRAGLAPMTCICGIEIQRGSVLPWTHVTNPGPRHHYARPRWTPRATQEAAITGTRPVAGEDSPVSLGSPQRESPLVAGDPPPQDFGF